jgi:DNA-binding NarL/FixJ family response regulator
MPIRVFHCDDSEAFTRLVAFWLAEYEDIEHAGRAHTAQEVLQALPEAHADVVLLDTLGKPGDDTLLNAIREVSPGVKVIVYSGYVRIMQQGALGASADAYLEKGDDDAPLIAAIRAVTNLKQDIPSAPPRSSDVKDP